MKLIAFDPGGTTGWCIVDYTPLGAFSSERFTACGQLGDQHYVQLYDLLTVQRPNIIVCERFDYVGGKTNVDLMAKEYIGVIELWVRKNSPPRLPVVMQSRSLKDFWDNDKLKKLGLYKRGMPHANDAIRHTLVWLQTQYNPNFETWVAQAFRG